MKNLIKFSFIGIFLTCISFTLQNCDTAKTVSDKVENKEIASKLKGTWVLKSINGVDAGTAFKGTIPNITFDFNEHRVYGNGGCNQFNGGFALIGNMFTPTPMASTMMACAQKNKESDLLTLLGQKSTLVFNNYTLQMVQNGKVVLEYTPLAR
ncbi:META domain-containing protein [Apibacter raozihei]|uniref:META domain-containing protein n=1 Tax=Apibacter TaxID=1778601 RepID=UPI000FE32763|nr:MULTISPECIES: META domain-containing protein [Apibacter]